MWLASRKEVHAQGYLLLWRHRTVDTLLITLTEEAGSNARCNF